MTAYIAVEEIISGNLSLSDQVHISEKAWRMEGSKMFVGVNTQVSVEDLLRGIIIQSGNDASVAIAEHIAGSEEAFSDMMNQYGELLGMSSSFFMNSSGLDTELYYNTMSARDLSLLAQATIERHMDYYPIYAEREFREDCQVLVATEAAGEGINLQFCWYMINYDIPWNPNRLEQRMGRIHRYGQEKDCLISNFVSTNTREG